MDATAAESSGTTSSRDDEERLRSLGNFICSSQGPLAAALQLHRGAGDPSHESLVGGGSMGASVPNGARIRLVAAGRIERGQIVAFVADGKTFVHRVRWRGHVGGRGWLLTQGDALRLPDPPVRADSVLGRVAAVESDGVWQPPHVRHAMPRRDRALSLIVLTASVPLLEIHPRLAGALIARLRGAEARSGWTAGLLYGQATAPQPRSSLVLALAVAACRLGALALRLIRGCNVLLMRLWDSGQRLLGALCNEALTLPEKSRLTVRIYDFFPGYHRTFGRLHEWEVPWFARRLPPAPARILIGGAGVGREAVALRAGGLDVDAFDPAPDLVAACRRALGEGAHVDVLSYEAFGLAVLDRTRPIDAAWRPHALRYDAILLGSGSVAHVLDPDEHARLLRACAALCPSGPILMSFYCDDAEAAPHPGLAARAGARIGRALAAVRGLKRLGSPRLSYRPHGGFAYTFTRQEIDALAASIGRGVTWEPGTSGVFHCVTLLPPAEPAAPH